MYVPGLFGDPNEARQKALANAQAYGASLPDPAAMQGPPMPTWYDSAVGSLESARRMTDPMRLVGLLDDNGRPVPRGGTANDVAMTFMPGSGVVQGAQELYGAGQDAMEGNWSRAGHRAAYGTLLGVADLASTVVPGVKGAPKGGAMNEYGKGQRGMAALPNLRGKTTEEAIALARGEPHLIPTTSSTREGYYVGGPQSVKSPEDMGPMRAEFDRRVAAGAEGRDWYGNARAFNVEIAGPDPMRQRLAAHEQALWSAQADPNTNLGFALQGHNAYEAGVPMDKVRTGAQAENYNQARDAGQMPSLGKKTGIYGIHLDPSVPYATTGTNDIWHARALGYQNKDGTPLSRAIQNQEHTFMDYETMLAADRANASRAGGMTDWNGPRVQAAPWVGGKGEALHERFPKSYPTVQAGVKEAAKTYPDYAPRYTFSATGEQIPGKSTGILPSLLDASPAEKQAFSNASSWKTPDGRDTIYGDAGMWVRRTQDGQGRYTNSAGQVEHNPVEVGLPLVSFKPGDPNGALQPHDRAMLNAGEATRGLLDAQEGAAGNMIVSKGKTSDQVAFHVNMGRQPTASEMDRLTAVAEKHGYNVANSDNGVSFIDFGFSKTGKDATKDTAPLRNALRKQFPDAELRRGRPETVYQDFSEAYGAQNAGQGKATQIWADEMAKLQKEAPGYFQKLLDSEGISKKAGANLKRYLDYGGAGQRPDYETLLKTVSEGKLRGLWERIQKQGTAGLPAIAAGALGASAARGLLEEDDARQ